MLLDYNCYRTFLKTELERRVGNNPSYSQRSFANFLKMSPGELSEVLNGKRNLSVKSVLKVCRSLGLNQTEAKHLMQLVQFEKAQDHDSEAILLDRANTLNSQVLTVDMFNAVSEWYHFAIINLSECEGFKWNTRWIAKRLKLTTTEVKIAVERMLRIGLLERVSGKIRVSSDYVQSPEGIPSEAIRNYHRQILNKSIQALDTQTVEERDISGVGFALNPKKLPLLKKDIAEFLDKMANKYSSGPKTEVYQLETALVRLTDGEKK